MLWRKMLRDLLENKGSYIACMIIMVIGLMVYTSFSVVMDNVTFSKDSFYFHQNFADGFAQVQAMPDSEIAKLGAIEGIADIQGRLVKDVRVMMPGREENIYLRLVSTDPAAGNPINGVKLELGIPLQEGEMNIWLDNKFFAANRLELNDQIEVIAEGKKRSLRIIGAGSNPEFIYAMRNSSDLFPKPEEFGIAYLPYDVMKSLFLEKGTVNSLVFTLQPGAAYQDVEDRLKPELEKYGLLSLYPRKDQTSYIMLSTELEQLKNMGTSLPLLFLSVAAIILYIMLKRMIENQRGQIGVLKALGYTRREILSHYMSYALVIGLTGGLLGALLGIALSHPFTLIYQTYFNLPGLKSSFSGGVIIQGVLLGLVFAGVAGYRGCRKVLTLEPADAMRPRTPLAGRSVFLEEISFFWHMLTVQGKMAVRNLSRHLGRSAFIMVGIMFTFALIGSCWSMWEMSEKMLFEQFEKIEVYDVKINLDRHLEQKGIESELSRAAGVKRVETKAEIPATLKHNWHKKDVVILGLPDEGELHRIFAADGRRIYPPKEGILLSQRLAQLLDADVGSRIHLESYLLKDPDQPPSVEVTGIIPQFMGLNAYMQLENLQSLLGQGNLVTTAMLSMDPGKIPLLYDEYQNSAAIAGIEDRNRMLKQLHELMATFSGTIYIMLLIGVVVGFAIIYNSSIITVSERSRELASMMVLGMTPQEVLAVVTFEQWFLSFFGMLAGIPLTKLLLVALAQSISNDVYSMPASFGGTTILVGFLITVASIWVAQRAAARRIGKLQIVEVLKAGE